MSEIKIEPTPDLGVIWDPDAGRLARVLVSEERIEIVLCDADHEWVRHALETLKSAVNLTVVISCPEDKPHA